MRLLVLLTAGCLLGSSPSVIAQKPYPSFDYETAQKHELKPHRRTIPLKGIGVGGLGRLIGVNQGHEQLHLTLTVSPSGDVIQAEDAAYDNAKEFWLQIKPEILQWKFIPFEEHGKAVTAKVEEYVDLVPPERRPKTHVPAPDIRPASRISITLTRTGCFGSCPSYSVTVHNDRVLFDGNSFVVITGKHADTAAPDEVRALAQKFVAADFYSMDSSYRASVTDNPTYFLSIEIDGRKKEVEDYVGEWVGMPSVIAELEDAVDALARTERWIKGSAGLVTALQLEAFNFQSIDAQLMLKQALIRGQAATVKELLAVGVPLKPIPAPNPGDMLERVGWLRAASDHFETLQLLLAAGASKNDQNDKDGALAGAAQSGNLEAVRALIAYGANPNADLTERTITQIGSAFMLEGPGAGNILVYAAESGNPDIVHEILRYHPKLEARGREGKTAIFAAGDYRNADKEGARVECVRLLAKAGADVNARDKDGNTPLHGIFLEDVQEELLKLGADVNARNNKGETPIFTNVNDESISLFIAHGADLTIHNNAGQTVIEAAKDKGPAREAALSKAMLNAKPR